jgi:23S rRNA (pseudouridine1915-N3)-methyltransferase
MRLGIHVVGRMKPGPDTQMVDRYLERLRKAGPAIGLELLGVTEVPESRAQSAPERRREEAERLDAHRRDAALFLLDERGRNLPSVDLAQRIGALKDGGARTLIFAIGGPDGHDDRLRASCDFSLSFGAQTWPHQLVRIMLAEQLYRCATILSGHPYHRA